MHKTFTASFFMIFIMIVYVLHAFVVIVRCLSYLLLISFIVRMYRLAYLSMYMYCGRLGY